MNELSRPICPEKQRTAVMTATANAQACGLGGMARLTSEPPDIACDCAAGPGQETRVFEGTEVIVLVCSRNATKESVETGG